MKFEKEKEVHIYGIFHKNKCLYVGQSFTVQKRLYEHRRNSKMPASAKPEILHCCAESEAKIIEALLIKTLKRIGQATMNKNTHACGERRAGQGVFLISENKFFRSKNSAAKYIGVSLPTLNTILTKYAGSYFEHRLCLLENMGAK